MWDLQGRENTTLSHTVVYTEITSAEKLFTSLSITAAGVAAAVHQRFLHDLQAAEYVGAHTRQRPPTSISCRAASIIGVAASLCSRRLHLATVRAHRSMPYNSVVHRARHAYVS